MLEQCLKTDMETGSGRMVIADTAAAGGDEGFGSFRYKTKLIP